jgi:hypothetical protein
MATEVRRIERQETHLKKRKRENVSDKSVPRGKLWQTKLN